MSTSARRRRAARKSDKFARAVLAPLRPATGCVARCPYCLTRCMNDSPDSFDEPDGQHWFACDC